MTTMNLKPSVKPHCVMCGAVAGKPHQDPAVKGRIVTLHQLRKGAFDGEIPKGKLLCMICRDGIYAIRRGTRTGE